MTGVDPVVRDAEPGDVGALAQLWFDGWQDAHAMVLPANLRRLRTLDSFAQRLVEGLGGVRAAVSGGTPLGFAMVKGDELSQFYLAAEARGTGVAGVLMRDTLDRLATAGVGTAWLACAIGNDRATRFYEKSGWHRAGTVRIDLDTPEGIFPLDVWRYEIAVGEAG